MTYLAPAVSPDPHALFDIFPPASDRPDFEIVPAAALPEPYRGLLDHEHHMTVTVEEFHGGLVDVRVLAEHRDGNSYTRKIVLTLQRDGTVVQFGLVRVNLAVCSPKVRSEILAGRTPLGRVLIQNNVLRRIEPTAFLRVKPDAGLLQCFGLTAAATTYGRLGFIYCDEQPAVELLEIVAPAS
jgi:chorismate-pyruvate lyase